MPIRITTITNEEIYHVFNRSINKESIFMNEESINRFINICNYYRYPQSIRYSRFNELPILLKDSYSRIFTKLQPLVDIYAYAFMPNHYHFLLKQLQDGGITKFIAKTQISYAKYFNLRFNRTGNLFQTQFKAQIIETEEQLLHTSRYIHINPTTAYLFNFSKLSKTNITSFPYYCKNYTDSFVNTKIILSHFSNNRAYIDFVKDQVDYQRTLKLVAKLDK